MNLITLNNNSGINIDPTGKSSVSFKPFNSVSWITIQSTSPLPLNVWFHIAVVKNDNSRNKIYINGVIDTDTLDTSSSNLNTCTGISLASNAQANTHYAKCSISEFRIWTIARTATQITNNYNKEVVSNSAGLVIYYKFNQGIANGNNTGLTSLTDSTANAYHGTLIGFTLDGTTSNYVTGVTLSPVISLNNGTITYSGNAADVPTSSALFIQANPRGTGLEWFAVVKDDMKTAIRSYARGTSVPFIPSSQSVPVPFNNIVTTLMTSMNQIFYEAAAFNQPIGSWDTANVINMSGMFSNASAFNQPIGSWNTANVQTMTSMFAYTNFNQPIGSWNTANVTDMASMFFDATAFNQNISSWNVNNVTLHTSFSTNSALTVGNTPTKNGVKLS